MAAAKTFSLLEAHKSHNSKVQIFVVVSVQGDNMTKLRINELGLGPGTELKIKGQLSFQGPLIIDLDANSIALRSEEAQCIQVAPQN